MQTNLCTFSLSSTQLSKANPISIISGSTRCSQLRSICASQIPPTKKQSKEQYSITYTVYLHCFLCSFCPTQTMKPKSNQLIATNSNHFPTYHKCLQIISSHLQQHRTCKQTLIALETRKMGIMLHISQTIDMHTKTHCTYSNHHRSALCIKTQKHIYCYCMSTEPTSLRDHYCRSHRPNFIKNKIAQKGTSTQTKNGHTSTTTSTKPSAHQAGQGAPQERRKNSIQIHSLDVL